MQTQVAIGYLFDSQSEVLRDSRDQSWQKTSLDSESGLCSISPLVTALGTQYQVYRDWKQRQYFDVDGLCYAWLSPFHGFVEGELKPLFGRFGIEVDTIFSDEMHITETVSRGCSGYWGMMMRIPRNHQTLKFRMIPFFRPEVYRPQRQPHEGCLAEDFNFRYEVLYKDIVVARFQDDMHEIVTESVDLLERVLVLEQAHSLVAKQQQTFANDFVNEVSSLNDDVFQQLISCFV